MHKLYAYIYNYIYWSVVFTKTLETCACDQYSKQVPVISSIECKQVIREVVLSELPYGIALKRASSKSPTVWLKAMH